MTDVTEILVAIEQGDPQATADLLPFVYNELRRLAAAKMAAERSDHTLQATALVHEAYLRLVGSKGPWNGRGHFFGAAAEAMRRILVEDARRRRTLKAGREYQRVEVDPAELAIARDQPLDLLCLDEALHRLERADSEAAALVKLKFFAGLTMDETASALGVSTRTAYHTWTYARAWLRKQMDPTAKTRGKDV